MTELVSHLLFSVCLLNISRNDNIKSCGDTLSYIIKLTLLSKCQWFELIKWLFDCQLYQLELIDNVNWNRFFYCGKWWFEIDRIIEWWSSCWWYRAVETELVLSEWPLSFRYKKRQSQVVIKCIPAGCFFFFCYHKYILVLIDCRDRELFVSGFSNNWIEKEENKIVVQCDSRVNKKGKKQQQQQSYYSTWNKTIHSICRYFKQQALVFPR